MHPHDILLYYSPIRPYSARASAKIRIRIIPTNSLGCCALALSKQSLGDMVARRGFCMLCGLRTKVGAQQNNPVSWTRQHIIRCPLLSFQSLSPDTSVANDANGHSGTQTSKTASQTTRKVRIAIKVVVRLVCCLVNCKGEGIAGPVSSPLYIPWEVAHIEDIQISKRALLTEQRTSCADNDSNDEAVDSKDTSHNNGNDGFNDEVRPEHTHGGNAHSRLGRAIGRSKA